ncbi:MAG: glycosyltransferase family 1 protein [Chloroflexi bacterium]|nr:glycosyltransferase family 1 protein [Chloroflexota bacterium]
MRVELNGLFRLYPLTGTGQHLEHLVAALRAGYPDVEIVERVPGGRARGRFGKVWWEQMAWPMSARRTRAVLHAPHLAPPVVAPRAIVTAHDVIPFVLPEYGASRPRRLYNLLTRAGLRRTRHVIAVSHWTRRELTTVLDVPADRIHVIHNGIAASLSPTPDGRDEAVRGRFGLPARFALYLGALDARKNLGVLLRAWPGIWSATRVALVVAGRAPRPASPVYVDWFREHRDVPWLHVIGEVPEEDKAALYRAAAVFVFPSRYEGFGLDPVEAMACGVPVVASNATSIPEVVGDAAVSVSPDDADGWTTAVANVLSDPNRAASLRDAGIARARAFTWERAAEATMAVYAKAAG